MQTASARASCMHGGRRNETILTFIASAPLHWRNHRGGVGPIEAYSVTQNSIKDAPKHLIFMQKNPKIFWRGDTAQTYYLVGREHPSLYALPSSAPYTSKSWLCHCTAPLSSNKHSIHLQSSCTIENETIDELAEKPK